MSKSGPVQKSKTRLHSLRSSIRNVAMNENAPPSQSLRPSSRKLTVLVSPKGPGSSNKGGASCHGAGGFGVPGGLIGTGFVFVGPFDMGGVSA